MKKLPTFRNTLGKVLFAVSMVLSGPLLVAQERQEDELKEFRITIERTADGINMHSLEGSAWVDLGFSPSNDRTQAINEFGMTDPEAAPSDKDAGLAHYVFLITTMEDGVRLTGVEGTAWTELSFSLSDNEPRMIDRFGLIE